ncbi:PIN domain-containing protein [Streptomyces scabiei]|uniref:hypothetical protein n=1 Tax=Streptomyces scabiei TaxID=1930 RepID=UPI000A685A6A|nr:hypothetical protein [Streptomyces scabiei]
MAGIEAGVATAPGPVGQARYAQALAAVRHEFSDRIAPIGEPDALIAATALANG